MELKRDTATLALLNTDTVALDAYKARRNKDQAISDAINTLIHDNLEIKQLLTQILHEVQHGHTSP